jgi:hypothetical protein
MRKLTQEDIAFGLEQGKEYVIECNNMFSNYQTKNIFCGYSIRWIGTGKYIVGIIDNWVYNFTDEVFNVFPYTVWVED